MNKLSCHSSTSYDEIISFLNANKGKTVNFHYELLGYPTWGDDEIIEIKLDEEGLAWINDYLGSSKDYRNNSAYVHNIEVLN